MKELTERQKDNRNKKELARIETEKAQRPVESLTITIEWKRSYTWGMNPNASVEVKYKTGENLFYRDSGFKASGCGYDKESTVIAEIFNKYLKYKLYQCRVGEFRINGKDNTHPYGVSYYNGYTKTNDNGDVSTPRFNGGVGTSCYYKISEFIGGKFENIANGKTFGVFKYTDNE